MIKINEIETLAKQLKLNAKKTLDFNKYTWYSITHHSTFIEGSTLSESQVINLLEYGKTAQNKPFGHHLMVTDYYNALNHIIGLAQNPPTITIRHIRQIGAMVMKNTGGPVSAMGGNYNTANGDLRLGSVRAGTRQFPSYSKVGPMLKELCEMINTGIKNAKSFEDKCKLAFDVHFVFVSIHPFGDGNGRTARLLMNYIQELFDLPLGIVFKNDKIKYINALEAARKAENNAPFYKFMFSQYAKFIKKEIRETEE